jgi:hypothetical protein
MTPRRPLFEKMVTNLAFYIGRIVPLGTLQPKACHAHSVLQPYGAITLCTVGLRVPCHRLSFRFPSIQTEFMHSRLTIKETSAVSLFNLMKLRFWSPATIRGIHMRHAALTRHVGLHGQLANNNLSPWQFDINLIVTTTCEFIYINFVIEHICLFTLCLVGVSNYIGQLKLTKNVPQVFFVMVISLNKHSELSWPCNARSLA